MIHPIRILSFRFSIICVLVLIALYVQPRFVHGNAAAEFKGSIVFEGRFVPIEGYVAPENTATFELRAVQPAHATNNAAATTVASENQQTEADARMAATAVPNSMALYFKSERFRVVKSDGQRTQDELYLLNNARYMQLLLAEDGQPVYHVRDARDSNVRLVKCDTLPQKKHIMERECKGMEISFVNRKKNERQTRMRLYYDPELFVNAKSFKKIARNCWNEIFGLMQAVPIHVEIESWRFPGERLIYSAVEIVEGMPDDMDIEPRQGTPMIPH